jgi:DNA-binding phage protein
MITLNAAPEENDQKVFLLALRDITEARGFSRLAQDASLNRENLYRAPARLNLALGRSL